jgi:hypothetical protein
MSSYAENLSTYNNLINTRKSSLAKRHGGALGKKKYSSFTTSTLDGGEWSASRPGNALPPGNGPPGTHSTGGWVDRSAGLDTEEESFRLCRGSILDRLVVQPVVRHYTD